MSSQCTVQFSEQIAFLKYQNGEDSRLPVLRANQTAAVNSHHESRRQPPLLPSLLLSFFTETSSFTSLENSQMSTKIFCIHIFKFNGHINACLPTIRMLHFLNVRCIFIYPCCLSVFKNTYYLHFLRELLFRNKTVCNMHC